MVYRLMEGIFRSRADPIQASDDGHALAGDLAEDPRRELLASISSFILQHDLAVNAENLAAACSAFSGAAPWLARSIAARAQAGEPITGSWLKAQHTGEASQREREAPFRLAEELDRSLRAFVRNSGSARNVTTKFGLELGRHVDQLDEIHPAVATSSLAALVEEMAERTRWAEMQLRESEKEAEELRLRLDRARTDAERDHLTGLPNRRAFEFVFKRQYEEAKTAREALSVAFCDVDRFKDINDRHGHDAGDRILKFIAETLSRISDNNCHVARHGGEEFVVLFRGYGLDEAADKLNGAREELAARKLVNRHTDEPIGQISFSAGLADVWRYPGRQEALRAADDALLCAKRSGRNRVIIAEAGTR